MVIDGERIRGRPNQNGSLNVDALIISSPDYSEIFCGNMISLQTQSDVGCATAAYESSAWMVFRRLGDSQVHSTNTHPVSRKKSTTEADSMVFPNERDSLMVLLKDLEPTTPLRPSSRGAVKALVLACGFSQRN